MLVGVYLVVYQSMFSISSPDSLDSFDGGLDGGGGCARVVCSTYHVRLPLKKQKFRGAPLAVNSWFVRTKTEERETEEVT